MADNVTADPGTGGAVFRTDDDGVAHWPYTKLAWGADNTQTIVAAGASAIPIQDGGNSLTVDDGGITLSIDDGAGSLTVDGTITANLAAGVNNIGDVDVLSVPVPLSIVGGGTEAAVLRVTLANDSTGLLSVDDNGGSLTVDGTVAVTQGSAVNLNATVVGTGSFAVQVDGPALTSLQLIDDTVFAEDVAATAADKGIAVLAVRRDADTSLVDVDNDYANLQVDANGALKVEIFDGGGSHTVDDGGGSLTVDGTVTAAQATAANLNATVVGTGTFAVQVDGNALTALQLIDDIVKTDDAAFTVATDKVAVVGFIADETSTDSIDEGDAGAARMTLDRKVLVSPSPHTNAGLTIFRSIDLDETEEEVKGTAGCVYSVWASNMATATRFLKFYNATAANVTVGTTTPVITVALPGNTSDDISAHFTGGGFGIAFSTAITVAATTGIADADTGAPAANDVIVNIFYK